jgi:hypothetical protein
VQELLNAKRRLEVLEVKGHERDLQIQSLTVANRNLTENNKVLIETLLKAKAQKA